MVDKAEYEIALSHIQERLKLERPVSLDPQFEAAHKILREVKEAMSFREPKRLSNRF